MTWVNEMAWKPRKENRCEKLESAQPIKIALPLLTENTVIQMHLKWKMHLMSHHTLVFIA